MIDFPQVYNHLIRRKQAENVATRYTDDVKHLYHASSAGRCMKLQQYSIKPDAKQLEVDDRTSRLFRLGDLMHGDIQDAIYDWFGEGSVDGQLLIEHQVRIPKWNVRGFLDVALVTDKKIYLYDIKTCASFKWRKTFGRDSNRDKNPSVNYEMQLATYATALMEEFSGRELEMALVWYNKDNSDMREMPVSNEFLDKADMYWNDVNGQKDCDLLPGIDADVPVQAWECRYCNFIEQCGGVPKA